MLQIPVKIEYALILLVILAKDKENKPMSLQDIADSSAMPYRFLTQIVKPLIKADIIQSKEGKGGGYILAKEPEKISVKDILQCLGEPLSFAKCFDSNHTCPADKNCKMKLVWAKIKISIDKELESLTLNGLI